MTELQLEILFGGMGYEVQNVRIVEDIKTGESKGYGFVTFRTADEARKVQEMGVVQWNGRVLQLDRAVKRKTMLRILKQQQQQFAMSQGTLPVYFMAQSPDSAVPVLMEGQVVDIESMKYILRYNDYPKDPYSDKNPYNSICSRGDLLIPSNSSPSGCYDTKETDYSRAKSLMSEAISGPTYQGLPVFCWSHFKFPNKHVGLPNCYDFDFVTMKPKWQ
ncbi:Phospholipase B-like 1 [Desmophyllum pertusum]|uniref:Phospholipase B-like n=1 Tax=Desmophyllum pertusum TaxID=174260 RepID=A0A9W9YK06_9CNID|nr:Phospholipase B-like 1 [Desmophyllum pertusum]